MPDELPKQYDPQAAQAKWYAFWEERGYFNADPGPGEEAAYDHDSAAQRHRGAAHGARAQRHAAGSASRAGGGCRATRPCGCPAPITPASPRRPWSNGGCSKKKADPARHRPRSTRRTHLEMEGRVRGPHPRPAQAARRELRLAADAVHARRSLLEGRAPDVLQDVQGRLDLSRQAARQLGHASADGRRRRRSLTPKTSTGHFWTFKYPVVDDAGNDTAVDLASPPRGRKRCSATRPSACIPPTSATSTSSARQVRIPLNGRADPDHRRRPARRPGARHRLREGDAGPRPERLRLLACATRDRR